MLSVEFHDEQINDRCFQDSAAKVDNFFRQCKPFRLIF
jgi:hypothetical protein